MCLAHREAGRRDSRCRPRNRNAAPRGSSRTGATRRWVHDVRDSSFADLSDNRLPQAPRACRTALRRAIMPKRPDTPARRPLGAGLQLDGARRLLLFLVAASEPARPFGGWKTALLAAPHGLQIGGTTRTILGRRLPGACRPPRREARLAVPRSKWLPRIPMRRTKVTLVYRRRRPCRLCSCSPVIATCRAPSATWASRSRTP